jgi:hypothetical protein
MGADRELGRDPSLDRTELPLLEARDRGLSEGFVAKVG